MYFRQFTKGYYDLKNNGNEKLVTDLMTRVKVREKVIDEISLYDSYDVPSGCFNMSPNFVIVKCCLPYLFVNSKPSAIIWLYNHI